MKKFFALMLTMLMVLSLVACGGSNDGGNEVVKMRFVTGGESGTYYAFGGTIAQHATNNADGIEVIGVTGAGSQANIQELSKKGAELAFCQSDVMAYAYDGTNLFAESGKIDGFSTVAALYMEQVQIVTCDPSIKTVADLKGKRVSIGAAGSGVYFNAVDVLGAYGLDVEKDIKPTYQSFGDSVEALQDGKIDAAFVVAGAPTTAVTSLATTKQVYLVSLDQEHIDALIAESPYYSPNTIAASVYNTPADVTTVAVGAVVIARDDVSAADVYNFLYGTFENLEALTAAHAKGAELSLEFAASYGAVPYHPGAVEYFKEKDIDVPAK